MSIIVILGILLVFSFLFSQLSRHNKKQSNTIEKSSKAVKITTHLENRKEHKIREFSEQEAQNPQEYNDRNFFHNYDTIEWKQKSEEIKKRDNYTCQNCKCYNPSLGDVFIKKQDSFEIHSYNKFSGEYNIINSEYGIDVSILFGSGYKIVMPILNVHHKRYIIGREIWDYDDEELITLCQNCHQEIHSSLDIEIPIVEELTNGKIIKKGKFPIKPKDKLYNEPKDIKEFKPWSIVRKEKDKYRIVEELQPSCTFLYLKASQHTIEREKELIAQIVENFMIDNLGFHPKRET